MDTSHAQPQSETRKAAVGGLAVVGFVALILIGIATAIYAASYLPKAIGKLSSANVYLSSLVQPSTDTNTNGNQLQPVAPPSNPVNYTDQPATTTIPITVPTGSQPTTNPTYTPPVTTTPAPTTPTYTQPTYTRVQVPYTPNYYGQPDLVTTITSVGYLRNDGDTSSFVAANTVPSGYQGAVRFVIANRGTNVSPTWRFRADLPTGDNQSDYRSASQQSLKPGDSMVLTLGFDNQDRGSDSIRITADSDNAISESNENNNTDTASIYFNGTSNGSNSSNNSSYDSNGNYCRYGTYYQNGRYYCETSNNSNNNSQYDSNGNYCRYGTYYQNGRYYCETSNNSNNNNSQYDSNGNYCRYGTYYQNGRYYCDSSSNNNNNGGDYDSNGNYCSYGTYYYNGRYYCS